MHAVRLALIFLLAVWSLGANAASLDPNQQDCAKILQRWAENPASVPKHLVDACKEKMTAAAPIAALAAAPSPAAVDPCAGPDAASSVLCWGPWASLAPAAAGPATALEIPDFPGDCEIGSEIADQCVARLEPPPEPPLPIEGCAPGTPCGFATLVDGLTSDGDVEETSFERFNLAPDGTSFVVDPGGDGEIRSVDMTTNIAPRADGFENLRSHGRDGDAESALIARIVRDDSEGGGDIQLATNVWTQANRVDSSLNHSGYFAWGIATSQSGLNLLNGNGVSVDYSGAMSVDKSTIANMTVNFGGQPGWTGTWTNPAWSFGAGGTVSGVNMISNPAQFTDNVAAGSFVQGALLGEPGRLGIAHIIDVNLADQGHIRDVGLLREIANPGPGRDVASP